MFINCELLNNIFIGLCVCLFPIISAMDNCEFSNICRPGQICTSIPNGYRCEEIVSSGKIFREVSIICKLGYKPVGKIDPLNSEVADRSFENRCEFNNSILLHREIVEIRFTNGVCQTFRCMNGVIEDSPEHGSGGGFCPPVTTLNCSQDYRTTDCCPRCIRHHCVPTKTCQSHPCKKIHLRAIRK